MSTKNQSAEPGSQESIAAEAAFARQVLAAEAQAIAAIPLDESFHRAVELILTATAERAGGSVVVSGLGKSNFIGQKLSATFASTGTPSHFLHPTEAMHGDLGRIRRGDVVLLLSFSGQTDEIVGLATVLRQDAVPVLAIVGGRDCDLGRLATVALEVGPVAEACPMNLAPTASTTAMLALGDALALSVMRRRNFGVEEFRKFHPGGALGRQLMPVVEVLRFRAGQTLPLIHVKQTVDAALRVEWPGGRRAGALLIVGDDGKLAGIVTDGDLRRLLLRNGTGFLQQPIGQYMTANPRRLTDQALVRDAVQMVREFRIDEIPVVDGQNVPLGLIDVQDLVALKVIEG
jgi:arabinose-5-phosphate isomerase